MRKLEKNGGVGRAMGKDDGGRGGEQMTSQSHSKI